MIYTDLNLALSKQNSYVYDDSPDDINISLEKNQRLNLFLAVNNEKKVNIILKKNSSVYLNSLILSEDNTKLDIEITHADDNTKSKIYSGSL